MPAPCDVTKPPMKMRGNVANVVSKARMWSLRWYIGKTHVAFGPTATHGTSVLVNEVLLPLHVPRLRQPDFLDQRVAVLVPAVVDHRDLGEVPVRRRRGGVVPLQRRRLPRVARRLLAP